MTTSRSSRRKPPNDRASKKMASSSRSLSLPSLVVLWPILAIAALSLAHAADYYVSPTGIDTALGTLDQPFQTIQKAADVAVAGDIVYIRAGVYRETVTPKNSGGPNAPITFMPYNGERVTISGADLIDPTTWSVYNGNIYQAPMNWDLGDEANQVFLDGQMMVEARWPNTTLDLSNPTTALTTRGSFVDGGTGLSTGTITDPNLPLRPAGYWDGATLSICLGVCYHWQSGRINNSSVPNQLTFTFQRVGDLRFPGANNPYYVTGKLGELDAPGEWFRGSSTTSLYFWPPSSDNPAGHTVEAKRRQFAFDLSGKSFITIQAISLFAASITTDSTSGFLVLDGLDARYLSHFSRLSTPDPNTVGDSNSGIILDGTGNVLRNSTLAWSGGHGVLVNGSGHRVFNNAVHDVDYLGLNNQSPVTLALKPSDGVMVAWNTANRAAREGIVIGGMRKISNIRIIHNDIYEYGLQTTDLGCIYTYGTDGRGSELAYNLCHDGHALLLSHSYPWAAGIYLDNGSSDFVVHHNLVWNIPWAVNLNDPGTNHQVYNNTFIGSNASFTGGGALPGSILENNIFVGPLNITPVGAILTNNLLPPSNPKFVDPSSYNFQLQQDSPAIGAGVAIPGITDGFSGAAPDIGAYDHTKPAWKAGVQNAAYTVSAADHAISLTPGAAAFVTGTVPFDQGASITFTDAVNKDIPATILAVVDSPPQLIFQVPANAALGVAMITITNGDGTISLSSALVLPSVGPPNRTGVSGTRVLFDETHSEYDTIDLATATQMNPSNVGVQYLGNLVTAMQPTYQVSRLTSGPLTAEVLRNTDVLVLAAPRDSLAAAENLAVWAFVQGGGSLVYLGSARVHSPKSINTVLSPWGMTFDNEMIVSPALGYGNGVKLSTFANNPAVGASPSFITRASGSFTVSQNAIALGSTSAVEWKSVSGQSTQQSGDPNGPFVIIAAAQPGSGRVFAVGDDYFNNNAPTSNITLFLSALKWLTAGSNTPSNRVTAPLK